MASVITVAIAKGMTMDELAAATDISLIDFVDPHARVPDRAISELMNGIIKRWPDVPISMEIARSAPISMLGGLAQGSQFAPNVAALLAWWAGNQWIVADQTTVYIEQTASEVALVLQHPGDGSNNGVAMEAGIGVHWRLLNAITDLAIPLLRVEFAYEKPWPMLAYEAFFQAPVSFQTGRNALVFAQENVGTPLRLANPEMFELIDHQFAARREQRKSDLDPPALAKLRQSIIANAAQGEYRATAAAAAINLSLRSAQRLAAQHHTSLQRLIDEVRLAKAKTLLNDPELTIERVSQIVGYTDSRAFRRAFKRLTGLTPKIYRSLH